MKAAMVHEFGRPPRYDDVDAPRAEGEHDVLVDVVAVGLHPRVRSGADGTHYTSDGILPLIPGVDGVGRLADGRLVFFVAPDTAAGPMAEQAVIDRRRMVSLPEGVDPLVVAAGMNPAMSSWVALSQRIPFAAGQSVLVLGATGSAGRMAVQIAARLGAGRVVGAGRNPELLATLADLGADATVSLVGEPGDVAARLGATASEVDIVLDYLWGAPATSAMPALVRPRSDRSRPMTWIQIGSVAGTDASVPSAILRSANFTLVGSGQGSVTTAGYLAALPSLVDELASGSLAVDAIPVPLADIESEWDAPVRPGGRVVVVP